MKSLFTILIALLFSLCLWANDDYEDEEEVPMTRIQKARMAQQKRLEEERKNGTSSEEEEEEKKEEESEEESEEEEENEDED